MSGGAGPRHWLATSWVPAALMAGLCLVVAGAWPVFVPPPAPLPSVAPSAVSSPRTLGTASPTPPLTTEDRPPGPPAAPSADPSDDGWPHLVIESVGIVAPVDRVGTRRGEVVIPEDPRRVGLWTGGAHPGDAAGAVLVTGHVSWNSTRGALWGLAATTPGDEVLLSAGATLTRWVVTHVEVLPRDADHPQLFTREGPHRLAVVTCAGPVTDAGYRDLVVVHAEPAA